MNSIRMIQYGSRTCQLTNDPTHRLTLDHYLVAPASSVSVTKNQYQDGFDLTMIDIDVIGQDDLTSIGIENDNNSLICDYLHAISVLNDLDPNRRVYFCMSLRPTVIKLTNYTSWDPFVYCVVPMAGSTYRVAEDGLIFSKPNESKTWIHIHPTSKAKINAMYAIECLNQQKPLVDAVNLLGKVDTLSSQYNWPSEHCWSTYIVASDSVDRNSDRI